MPLKRVRNYTLAIANGTHKRKPTESKIWFTSIKSFAAVLSDENQELLRLEEGMQGRGRRAVTPVAGSPGPSILR